MGRFAYFKPRFLVISLGMPGKNPDVQSAGHVVLDELQRLFHMEKQPSFGLNKIGKRQTMSSLGPKFSLLKSPERMEHSGPYVKSARADLIMRKKLDSLDLHTVIIHDKLDDAFGSAKLRYVESGHFGHKGVKGIKSCFAGLRAEEVDTVSRICVGVGSVPTVSPHPPSTAATRYLSRALTPDEIEILRKETAVRAAKILGELERLWLEKIEQNLENPVWEQEV